jgi:glutathione S-transferase
MYTLYSMQRSGNSYKVRLAWRSSARLTGWSRRHLEGEAHTRFPEEKSKRASATAGSGAGRYLANPTPFFGTSRAARAGARRSDRTPKHCSGCSSSSTAWSQSRRCYFWLTLVKGGRDLQRHAFEDWMEEGHRALGVMEKHVAQRDFLSPTAILLRI